MISDRYLLPVWGHFALVPMPLNHRATQLRYHCLPPFLLACIIRMLLISLWSGTGAGVACSAFVFASECAGWLFIFCGVPSLG